jgi:hypothetical protein
MDINQDDLVSRGPSCLPLLASVYKFRPKRYQEFEMS